MRTLAHKKVQQTLNLPVHLIQTVPSSTGTYAFLTNLLLLDCTAAPPPTPALASLLPSANTYVNPCPSTFPPAQSPTSSTAQCVPGTQR